MTSDERLIDDLRGAMAREVQGHHLDRAAAVAVAWHGSSDRRPKRVLAAAVAAGVVVVAGVAVGYAMIRPGSHGSTPTGSGSCEVQYGVLPTWARAGFSEPRPKMPYVLSDKKDIIAILWSRDHPLNAPPMHDQNNKILWVSPDPGAPLRISAHLGSTTVTRAVANGPGPSIIDVPGAGCWTFDLSWGHEHDTVRLPYRAP